MKCDVCLTDIVSEVPDEFRYRPKFCSIICARKSGMDLSSKGIPYFVYIETLGQEDRFSYITDSK